MKDDLLFDFSLTMPRILVSGNIAVVDNAKRIVSMDETSIIIDTGKTFVEINGLNLMIKRLEEQRMIVNGRIGTIEFHKGNEGATV